jgi:hypothetical protein
MSSVHQAQVEKLTLLVAKNTTGYFGVYVKHDRPKPYKAQVKRSGKDVYLGSLSRVLCAAEQSDDFPPQELSFEVHLIAAHSLNQFKLPPFTSN